MRQVTLEFHSALRASADEVWRHAASMQGVNDELAPWVSMSVPRALRNKTLADVEPGREAFVSTLRLLSVLPFDRHHLALERILARGFDEESWSWLQRRWRHERRVEPTPTGGCTVTDRLTIAPRLAPIALVKPIVQQLFRARHRRLRARFGDAAP